MHRGYVKLWRKSLDSGMLKKPELWVFWCWCLMKASHKPFNLTLGYQQICINAGSFVFGRSKAASALGLSEQVVRSCLNSLKSTSRLTIKSTNKFSIISIINWDSYQSQEKENNQQNNQQSNQQLTSNQPAINQQLTTNKNVEEQKTHKLSLCDCDSLKKKSGTLHKQLPRFNKELFDLFWEAYPKKKSKGQAESSFAKLNPDKTMVDMFVAKLEIASKSEDWTKDRGQFIPYPATWLNAKGWEDEFIIGDSKSPSYYQPAKPLEVK